MERDFSYNPPYMDYGMPPNFQGDPNDPILNPMMQYEQACQYYRYLCLQLDYKMKCKEYERMCKASSNSSSDRRDRKIE